jgi:acyl carrier protein
MACNTPQQLWLVLVGCVLGLAGCGDRRQAAPLPAAKSGTTVEQVCEITALLLRVDRSKVRAETSLGDLGADDLDLVELVMELEEHFNIDIPDDAIENAAGTKSLGEGMKNITMAKLASVVDKRKMTPRSGKGKPPVNGGQSDNAAANGSGAANGTTPPEKPQAGKVKVFLNPLVMLLAGAEKQKGRPLNREEVLEVRDKAVFVMMSPEQSRKFYESLDAQAPVPRLDPDRVWEEWQEIRGKLK